MGEARERQTEPPRTPELSRGDFVDKYIKKERALRIGRRMAEDTRILLVTPDKIGEEGVCPLRTEDLLAAAGLSEAEVPIAPEALRPYLEQGLNAIVQELNKDAEALVEFARAHGGAPSVAERFTHWLAQLKLQHQRPEPTLENRLNIALAKWEKERHTPKLYTELMRAIWDVRAQRLTEAGINLGVDIPNCPYTQILKRKFNSARRRKDY